MAGNLVFISSLIIVGLSGCATTTRDAVKNVQLGMSPDEVLATAGESMAQAKQDSFEAWRYEYKVTESCFGMRTCSHVCEHATLWFGNNEVRSMTVIRVDSMEECGKGSIPIFWQHMPDYVKAPDG